VYLALTLQERGAAPQRRVHELPENLSGKGDDMPLTLTRIRQIVAREQDPALEVVRAIAAGGESLYSEVILTIRGCQVEPCRLMVGVNRSLSESECRTAMRAGLKRDIASHKMTNKPEEKPDRSEPSDDHSERPRPMRPDEMVDFEENAVQGDTKYDPVANAPVVPPPIPPKAVSHFAISAARSVCANVRPRVFSRTCHMRDGSAGSRP
jgi:hypothetical protein